MSNYDVITAGDRERAAAIREYRKLRAMRLQLARIRQNPRCSIDMYLRIGDDIASLDEQIHDIAYAHNLKRRIA